MKKLIAGICLLFAVTSCEHKPDQKVAAEVPSGNPRLPKLITLNGYSLEEADVMVNSFIKSPGAYKSPTSIWFDKKTIHSLVQLLTEEGADGLRVYYARSDSGNTLILVSTRDHGAETNRATPATRNHKDYFEHNAPFLGTKAARGKVSYDDASGGALLYTKVPCQPDSTCDRFAFHYVSCEDAKDWATNFSDDPINTTSEWFDLKLLQDQDKELQMEKNGADGLRFYYVKKRKDNRHAFVLVTTRLVANGTHEDYFGCFITKFFDANDNGEECPNSCNDVTWPEE